MVYSKADDLDLALEGASDVVYFTHDYVVKIAYSLGVNETIDKDLLLQKTSKLCKKHGVRKLVAVCPIEHELYWQDNKQTDALMMRDESHQKAMQSNPNMTILTTNLVYGKRSYFIQYLTQCITLMSKINRVYANSMHYKYEPLSVEDVAKAVEMTFNDGIGKLNGKMYGLNGEDKVTLKELVTIIEK